MLERGKNEQEERKEKRIQSLYAVFFLNNVLTAIC